MSCEKNNKQFDQSSNKKDVVANINAHYVDENNKKMDYVEIEIGRVVTLVKFDSAGKVVLFSSLIKDGEYEIGDRDYNIRLHRDSNGKFLPYADPRTVLTGVDALQE